MTEPTKPESKITLEQTLAKLPANVKGLLPEGNMGYYSSTNEMHTDLEKPGGSKFLNAGNIFEVLEKDGNRIADGVKERLDDREALLAEGAPESAFLPATKGPDAPEGLPEALYYKVEGFKGKVFIKKLGELDPETRVVVAREKSQKDDDGKEKVPTSISVIQGTFEDAPDTDFATVIVGRSGGEEGKNEVWTIHPGAPIRTSLGEFLDDSDGIRPAEEGRKPTIKMVTVKEILDSGHLSEDDYIKLIPGNLEEKLSDFEVLE